MPCENSNHQGNIRKLTKTHHHSHDKLPGAKVVLYLEFSLRICVCKMLLKHCKERDKGHTITVYSFQIAYKNENFINIGDFTFGIKLFLIYYGQTH